MDAQFDSKSKPIPFAVSKGTNEYSGQSEHSELIRPLVVTTEGATSRHLTPGDPRHCTNIEKITIGFPKV